MQILKFNDAVKSALQTVGFEIGADDDTAVLRGEIRLELIAPVKGDLWLGIILPNDMTLKVRLSRADLLQAAETDCVN